MLSLGSEGLGRFRCWNGPVMVTSHLKTAKQPWQVGNRQWFTGMVDGYASPPTFQSVAPDVLRFPNAKA